MANQEKKGAGFLKKLLIRKNLNSTTLQDQKITLKSEFSKLFLNSLKPFLPVE